jgi:hypothetical protein
MHHGSTSVRHLILESAGIYANGIKECIYLDLTFIGSEQEISSDEKRVTRVASGLGRGTLEPAANARSSDVGSSPVRALHLSSS